MLKSYSAYIVTISSTILYYIKYRLLIQPSIEGFGTRVVILYPSLIHRNANATLFRS